jgi:hypothetical protein
MPLNKSEIIQATIFLLLMTLVFLLAMFVGWWTLQEEERELKQLDDRIAALLTIQLLSFVPEQFGNAGDGDDCLTKPLRPASQTQSICLSTSRPSGPPSHSRDSCYPKLFPIDDRYHLETIFSCNQ